MSKLCFEPPKSVLYSARYWLFTAKYLLCYIADTITAMTDYALDKFGDLPIVFAGGVMSDKIIKDIIISRFDASFAEPEFSCDNAAGIAFLTSLK